MNVKEFVGCETLWTAPEGRNFKIILIVTQQPRAPAMR